MELVKTMKEIPKEDFGPLLDNLLSDFPNSIHVWSFLKSLERWKAHNPKQCIKILAANGDYRLKFILIYSATPNLSDVMASAHKWSHKEDDEEIFREALKNYKEFPWLANGSALLTAMTEETTKVVVPLVKEIWRELDWTNGIGHYVYWMPKEDALKLEFEVPKNTYLASMTKKHAKEIDEIWPHRYNGSQELMESVLQFNFGLGLFDSETHELMSWALHWFYGGIGALQTKENHLRKGYGSVVLKAISREVAKRGDDVHLNVTPDNVASRALVEKINYRLAFRSTWINKQ